MKSAVIVLISFLSIVAFGQEVVAPVVAQAEPVLSLLEKINQAIPLSVAGWVLGLLTVVIELLMRFVPTAQPRSILILVSESLKKLAEIFVKVSSLLDKVVQNVKK
jgi:hypothetical protein